MDVSCSIVENGLHLPEHCNLLLASKAVSVLLRVTQTREDQLEYLLSDASVASGVVHNLGDVSHNKYSFKKYKAESPCFHKPSVFGLVSHLFRWGYRLLDRNSTRLNS